MILSVVAGIADQGKVVSAGLDLSGVVVEMEIGRVRSKLMVYRIYIVRNIVKAALSAFHVLELNMFEIGLVHGEIAAIREVIPSSIPFFEPIVV